MTETDSTKQTGSTMAVCVDRLAQVSLLWVGCQVCADEHPVTDAQDDGN